MKKTASAIILVSGLIDCAILCRSKGAFTVRVVHLSGF